MSKYILERYEIGHCMFVEFATERLTEGRLCVRDTMTKKKLKTFKTSNATIEMNAGGKLVKIKECCKTDRHLKKSTTTRSEGMHWHL